MQKRERQNTILELIKATRIVRQNEFVRFLTERGHSVTQASVSRDLDELGIVKVNGAYSHREPSTNVFGLSLISVAPAGPNMLVVKTASGLASASAVRIDAAKLPDIVGTIAGDDTIFIAVADETGRNRVEKKLWEIFKG